MLRYYGDRCESVTAIYSCADDPCDNNSTCIDGGAAGYTCSCPANFTGVQCTTNYTCAANYYGADCDVYCLGVNACGLGHYTCNSTSGGQVCLSGWTGTNCLDR